MDPSWCLLQICERVWWNAVFSLLPHASIAMFDSIMVEGIDNNPFGSSSWTHLVVWFKSLRKFGNNKGFILIFVLDIWETLIMHSEIHCGYYTWERHLMMQFGIFVEHLSGCIPEFDTAIQILWASIWMLRSSILRWLNIGEPVISSLCTSSCFPYKKHIFPLPFSFVFSFSFLYHFVI